MSAAAQQLADALKRHAPELRLGPESLRYDGYYGQWATLPPAAVPLKSTNLRLVFKLTEGC